MSRARYFHLSSLQMNEIRKRYPYPRQTISKEMSVFARRYGLTGRQLAQVIFHDWSVRFNRASKARQERLQQAIESVELPR